MLINFLWHLRQKQSPGNHILHKHLKICGRTINIQFLTTIPTLANDCVGTFGFIS